MARLTQEERTGFNRAKHVKTGRAFRLMRDYGITEADYARLSAKQNHRCAICKTPEPTGQGKRLQVDHDHETGAVRGLLCFKCNLLLGQACDDTKVLRAAVSYLIDPPNG